jgi:ribosome-interacting GTPase 1
MDSEYGLIGLNDRNLYDSIVEHRKKFNQIRGISYDNHTPDKINFLPPQEVVANWERDYANMRDMIYGETLNFTQLITRIKELQKRFRQLVMPTGETLKKIIEDARNNINRDFQNAHIEGSELRIPVHYLTDIYKPYGPGNENLSYTLTFIYRNGDFQFVEIENN